VADLWVGDALLEHKGDNGFFSEEEQAFSFVSFCQSKYSSQRQLYRYFFIALGSSTFGSIGFSSTCS
jgi:hypothetical protein